MHDVKPRKGITGNFPILNGTLNGLSSLGLLYLNHINEKFTDAKIAKAAKFVMPAINRMSPSVVKIIDAPDFKKQSINKGNILLDK